MKIKDSTIIAMIIFSYMMTIISVSLADMQMTRMENQLEALKSAQNDVSEALAEIAQINSQQDERLAHMEHHAVFQDMMIQYNSEKLENINDLFKNMLKELDDLEERFNAYPSNSLGLELTESDIRNISALVYLEAGSGSYKLQKAIASVIFNRMIRYHMSASQTIYQRGVFSPANRVARTIPSESCVRAVRDVMVNGLSLPSHVLAFQLHSFHRFGHPYGKIDNVYFTSM